MHLRSWGDSNPCQVTEEERNVPELTVWVGIWTEHVTGPFFLEGFE
jgi:hypothetical protein